MDKNDARKTFEHNLQLKIKEYLTYNHLVTDEDRDNMVADSQNNTHARTDCGHLSRL